MNPIGRRCFPRMNEAEPHDFTLQPTASASSLRARGCVRFWQHCWLPSPLN